VLVHISGQRVYIIGGEERGPNPWLPERDLPRIFTVLHDAGVGEFGRHNTIILDCAPNPGPYLDNVVMLQSWTGREYGSDVDAVAQYLLSAVAARPRSVAEYLRSHPQQQLLLGRAWTPLGPQG